MKEKLIALVGIILILGIIYYSVADINFGEGAQSSIGATISSDHLV